MWWGIGIGLIFFYLILAFTLGFMTLRNGHGWTFFFGDLLPSDSLDLRRVHEAAGDGGAGLGLRRCLLEALK